MIVLSNLTSVNGHTLTQPERNLLKKLETKHGLVAHESETVVRNVFTGVEVTDVTPVVAVLIQFVQQTSYGDFTFGGEKVAIGDFDRCRYLVMKLDNSAYFAILD
jgi:hypothetical protein